jgi:hypothetical protein
LGSFCSTIELHPHFNGLALKWPWAIPVYGSGSPWARQALPRASSCRQHAWCASSAICRRAHPPARRPRRRAPHRTRIVGGWPKDEGGRRITEAPAGPLFDGAARAKVEPDHLPTGTLYVLRSRSTHPTIAARRDLIHKIGITGGRSRGRSTTPGRPRWSRRGDAAAPGRAGRDVLVARRLSVRSGNLIRAAMRAGRGRRRSPWWRRRPAARASPVLANSGRQGMRIAG